MVVWIVIPHYPLGDYRRFGKAYFPRLLREECVGI